MHVYLALCYCLGEMFPNAESLIDAMFVLEKTRKDEDRNENYKSTIADVTAEKDSDNKNTTNITESNTRICVVCLDKERKVQFFPCNHASCCIECSTALNDCPVCRQKIVGTTRVYFS